MAKIMNTELFKQRVFEKFGDSIITDKVDYIDSKTKVILTCPIHGDFEVRPANFLNQSKGCPKCIKAKIGIEQRRTLEDVVEEVNIIHNGKYSYNKSIYEGLNKGMIITCPIHGDFVQKVSNHLRGAGCPKCQKSYKKTTEDFKEEFIKRFGSDIDLSKVNYKNSHEKVCLICPKHGEFWRSPHYLFNCTKTACPKCAVERRALAKIKPFEQFLKEAKLIHGNDYFYFKETYIKSHEKMKMKCNKCGNEFWQSPGHHLDGKGCPRCAESHLEREVRLFLEANNIKYIYEKKFPWLGLLSLDFYLLDYDIAIECQGKQHFGKGNWCKTFKGIMERDKRKNSLVQDNNIKLYYFCNANERKLLEECGLDFYNEENTIYSTEELKNILNI